MPRPFVVLLFALCLGLSCQMAAAAPPAPAAPDLDDMRLLRMPDLYGDQVVFVYGGDLWTVAAAGGEARRLTSSIGFESYPKFSPDGRWIAFSGEYDGNNDVYVMPAEGGEPVRLTFHPGWDRVIDWQPDGEAIRFQSARQSNTGRDLQLYTVPRTGGLPQKMILPTAGLSSYAPDGHRIAYTPTTTENRTWKRYKGGWAQDIWIYDLAANTSEQITDWIGADNFPMWSGDVIYYTSDREAGKLNIWAYDTRTRSHRQVTRHAEYDVKFPSLGGGHDGDGRIVYENGGWLWILDLAGGETRQLRVGVHSDQVWARPRIESAAGQMRGAGISPDGKRAVVDARGEIFSVPAKKGPVRNLTQTPGIRERFPAWSPDGKQVAYVADATDEYEIYLRAADGAGEPRKLTSGLGSWVNSLEWAPDGKRLAVSTAAMDLFLVDTATGKLTHVDRSPSGDINDYAFSPAGDWLAYARGEENNFTSLFLYDIAAGKTHRVTSDFTAEGSPCFDDEGKYLFFTSARHFNPTLGGFDLSPMWVNQDGLFLVTLRKDVPNPFPPESDEVGAPDDDQKDDQAAADDEGKGKREKGGKRDAVAAKPPLRVDLDGIANRIVDLDVPAGNYGSLSFAEGKLFYASRPFIPGGGDAEDGRPASRLCVFDLKQRESKTVLEKIDGYELTADGKKILYERDGKLGIVDAAPDQKPADEPLRTDEMKAMIDPRAEWQEMLRDAWRLERDFFYDPAMHQVDWPHMYDRYSQLVPYVAHGADFSYVVGEMISELNAGHAYVRPGDMPRPKPVGTGLLGCDYTLDGASGRYRFARILTERDWNGGEPAPLAAPGVDVKTGEYLLAVDGVELRAPANPFSLFVDKAGQSVRLTVGPRADGKDAREVIVVAIGDEGALRYEAWVQNNRRRVDELSGGKIGYLHLPNTAVGGQQGFAKGYYPQLRKEGLIIDERFNGGGFIPDFFMNTLRQKMVNFWRPRFGQDWRTPGTAFMGHMAMLSNGYAGSGGDALPYYFKYYELGPVIGTRTWGGLVGISRDIPLLDGGSVTFPEFGLYDLEGKLAVENHGVDPTIPLENLPQDEAAGRDAQLEKAVEVLLQTISQQPVRMPEFKGFPQDRK